MSDLKKVLREAVKEIKPDEGLMKRIRKISSGFCESLREELVKAKIKADVFVGGSFAKGTLVKKKKYDVDIFVRFSWEYEDLSDDLEPVLKRVCKNLGFSYGRVHGSRDYFMIDIDERIDLEVIPVTKIKKPSEERNVTDLSYFHVSYVKKKAKKLEGEIRLAKVFCAANGVYGAESYIQGFSGYALECLVIYYGSFVKMLRELVKVELGNRLVIDIEKHYKRKDNVFFEVNENKLQSPVILIDPTYKERNALASLSQESFEKFQDVAKKFLKNPSVEYFRKKEFDLDRFKKVGKGEEFVHVVLETDRQEGDIAGTKMKKFSNFLKNELSKYFDIKKNEFIYDLGQRSDFYLVVRSKREIVRIGPPVGMKDAVKKFKKEHRKTYVKNGFLHAKIKVDFSASDFIKNFSKEHKKTVNEMGITRLSCKP